MSIRPAHLVAVETRQADESSGESTQTNAFTVHSPVIVILMSSAVVYHKKFFQLYMNAGWTTNRIKSLDLFCHVIGSRIKTNILFFCRMGEKANIVIFKVLQTVDQIKPEMFWKITRVSFI